MVNGHILVLDPGSLTAVATVRALARAGWRVGIGCESGDTPACASRWCSSWHPVPDPEDGAEPFIEAINRAARQSGYDLVFGCGDAQVFALSHFRDSIRIAVPFSDDASLRRAFDKLTLTETAEAVGLGVPRTFRASDPNASRLSAPLIVKARWHWSPGGGTRARLPAVYCNTADEAFAAAERIRMQGAEAVIQEAHRGALMSFNVVTDKSFRPVAMNQHVAHAIWPLRAGTPARAVTIDIDAKLAEAVARLLERLRWFGLVNLQFIVPSDGIPRLIDFNGRPYQTIALSLAAGVNFMDAWARAAMDMPPRGARAGLIGVRYHDLVQDLLRIRATHGFSPVELFGCLGYGVRASHILWSLDDPNPAFHRYGRIFARQSGQPNPAISKHPA